MYSAMTRVAVMSLRFSNPKIFICVACDLDTNENLLQSGDSIINEVDEWIVINTPSGNAEYRNRFVKTSLRLHVKYPFLFLDSDVFIRGDISEIFSIIEDVGICVNHSMPLYADQIWSEDKKELQFHDWKIRDDFYGNGGVIFYNDTIGANHFAENWHFLWKKSSETLKRNRDQPSLNAALFLSNVTVKILPEKFNAQFKFNISVVKNALIWHYYSSVKSTTQPVTKIEFLCNALLQNKKIDKRKIYSLTKSNHPWVRHTMLDDYILGKAIKKGYFTSFQVYWLDRNYKSLLKNIFIVLFLFRKPSI
jgi:hypothetical protein